MKKIAIILMAAILAVCSCASLRMTPEEKAARDERISGYVADSLAEGHFKIYTDMMYPFRGGSKRLNTMYFVKVNGDDFSSYLPYVGQAWDLPYGGGHGLNFDAKIQDYAEQTGAQGQKFIYISLRDEEDKYLYTLEIYDNGRAYVDVKSYNREEIRFSGYMDLPESAY